MKDIIIIIVSLLVLFLFTCGCSTQESTRGVEVQQPEIDRQQEVAQLIQLLNITKPVNYLAACKKIIETYKEEALEQLGKGLSDSSAKVRIACLYCISEIYLQTNSSDALDLLPEMGKLLKDPILRVQLETASALCVMKDYRGVPLLITSLRSERMYIRWAAIRALNVAFQIGTFGYNHQEKNSKKREFYIRRWEDWWVKNKNKYLNVL